MTGSIITVGSVTFAVKAKKLLSRAGIKSELVKSDSPMADGGCKHGIRIHRDDLYAAVAILKDAGIDYRVK